MERIDIMGCPVDRLSLEQTVDRVRALLADGGVHQHMCVSASKIHKMSTDALLREAVLESDIVNADGAGVLFAARLLGQPVPERVTGIALFLRLVRLCAEEGYRPYFLGARPEVVAAVVRRFRHVYPSLDVAGARDGYFTEAEQQGVAEAIRDARPHMLFVAMGTPAKERFQKRWLDTMAVPFSMGVGGSFDVVANVARRSPPGVGELGLEWAYRLAQEPGRLWRRNLVDNGSFVAKVLAARFLGYRVAGGRA